MDNFQGEICTSSFTLCNNCVIYLFITSFLKIVCQVFTLSIKPLYRKSFDILVMLVVLALVAGWRISLLHASRHVFIMHRFENSSIYRKSPHSHTLKNNGYFFPFFFLQYVKNTLYSQSKFVCFVFLC